MAYAPVYTDESEIDERFNNILKDNLYSLNYICGILYLYRTYELTDDLRRDLWTFCSIGGGEIIRMDSRIQKDKFAQDHPFKEDLPNFVDVDAPSNDWFWEIRHRELFGDTFKYIDMNFFKRDPHKRSIRERCREFYKYETDEVRALAKEWFDKDRYNVSRFCGLATIPRGLRRTMESYKFEEILYGRKNWRMPTVND